jgi:acyl-CoA synthetase (NDP forming)
MQSTFNRQVYIDTIELLGKDDGVDIVLITASSWKPDYVELVKAAVRESGKPTVFVTTPVLSKVMGELLPSRGIVFYPDGRRAVKVLGGMVAYQRFRSCE